MHIRIKLPTLALLAAAVATIPFQTARAGTGNRQSPATVEPQTPAITEPQVATPPIQTNGKAILKKIVAVSRFENKTAYAGGGQYDLDNGMADQLSDALMQSGYFTVMERQTLGDVVEEQKLANSGLAQKSKSAESGKIVNAQILVKGTVTEYDATSSGSKSGIGFGGFKIGNNRQDAHVGLIIKLIDTTTGEQLDSQRVEGKASSGGVSLWVLMWAASRLVLRASRKHHSVKPPKWPLMTLSPKSQQN